MSLFNNPLYEFFSEANGQLTATDQHLDVRAFHTDNVTVPQKMLDFKYLPVSALSLFTVSQLAAPRSIVGASVTPKPQSVIDTYTQSIVDGQPQSFLDYGSISSGNENWPSTDPNVVVGKDTAFRYANTIRVSLTGGVSKTVGSSYMDDFTVVTTPSYVELLLRSFPAQAAGSHLDLTNSFIDFSSDINFAAGSTDSIAFNSSLNSLAAGGDVVFRVATTSLTHITMNDVRAIRFRLLSVGNITFIAQAMRLIPTTWTPGQDSIDTKRDTLMRTIPRNGGADGSLSITPLLWSTRPEDVTMFLKFNSGHAPATGTDDNYLIATTRYTDASNYINFQLTSRSTQSRLSIIEDYGGSLSTVFATSINTNILLTEQDYVMRVDLKGNQARAQIYFANGTNLGSLVYETGWQTITGVRRGQAGYVLAPYNYDFTLDYASASESDFVRYQSAIFESITPVDSTVLVTSTSSPVNLISGSQLIAYGDATSSTQSIAGVSPATLVRRNGGSWTGGLIQNSSSYVGNPGLVEATGDIYPIDTTEGLWRLALIDPYGSIGWIGYVTGLIPNQWNHFAIPIDPTILPTDYLLTIHQAGFYPDSFYIANLALNHLTILWEASADRGTTWQPFNFSINSTYSGIKFTSPGTGLTIRATATTDKAWIQGFQVKPIYKYTGRTLA